MAGKKKFSYYNDYSTVNFGGSGGQRKTRSSEGRPRRDREHKWCEDCSGTGVCSHCKDGRFPLARGGTTTCRKCSGNSKCHACRGSRLNGRKCTNSPTYEEALEQAERAKAARLATGIVEALISGAMTIGGVVGSPTQNAPDTMSNWADNSATQEADRRSRDVRGGTRDKGVRDRGTRRDPRR